MADAEDEDDAFDPGILIDVAGSYLLGESPNLTRLEVSERAGVDLATATRLWQSLGFAEADDDEVAFTDADVEALGVVERLTELRVLQPEVMQTFVRAMGRSFSRLADWQVRLLLTSLAESDDDGLPLELVSEVVPLVEEVQNYIWRRHLVAAASRLLLQGSSDATATPTTVGFVDIVGYTSGSRQMEAHELSEMVEEFEHTTNDLVVEHGGLVIKTIGDEVLFTVDDPVRAAQLALALVDRHSQDEDYPQVRVGQAHGPVLARLGDVFGPVVNVASRLTSVARPGKVVVDRALADQLSGDDRFRLERLARRPVKGYEHLEPWALKHPR